MRTPALMEFREWVTVTKSGTICKLGRCRNRVSTRRSHDRQRDRYSKLSGEGNTSKTAPSLGVNNKEKAVTTLLNSGSERSVAKITGAPIALVFTDMVGSSAAKRDTALGSDVSTRDRAFLGGILVKYLRLVRRAIAEHNGEEIMTIGDSFFLAFGDPVDAIRCCAAIQRRLGAEPIATPNGPMQLRIGIHVGTPEYFESSWHGLDVDIAARAQSAGSPGQIIVTEAAALKAIGQVPRVTFRPLGTFALKGVGDLRLWDADYDRNELRRPAIESIEQRRRKRIATKAVSFFAIIALASGAAWRWREDSITSVLASTARQSIAMANFENRAGHPLFDHTIKK
jgi:class 3 adenylate cyclase